MNDISELKDQPSEPTRVKARLSLHSSTIRRRYCSRAAKIIGVLSPISGQFQRVRVDPLIREGYLRHASSRFCGSAVEGTTVTDKIRTKEDIRLSSMSEILVKRYCMKAPRLTSVYCKLSATFSRKVLQNSLHEEWNIKNVDKSTLKYYESKDIPRLCPDVTVTTPNFEEYRPSLHTLKLEPALYDLSGVAKIPPGLYSSQTEVSCLNSQDISPSIKASRKLIKKEMQMNNID